MPTYPTRFLKLFFGLFLYALGLVFTLKANIGYGPWDSFHSGLSNIFGMTIGIASIVTGFFICVVDFLLGEKLGIGTILNMFLIGFLIDAIFVLDLIKTPNSFPLSVIMMISGLFIIAFGSFFYLGSGFGSGPRDALMVAINRKTHLSIGVSRTIVECIALSFGFFLGGKIGIGTVIYPVLIGFCVQVVFKVLKFDPKTVKHEVLPLGNSKSM